VANKLKKENEMHSFKGRVSKKDFEDMLVKEFGSDDLNSSVHSEAACPVMTLYYLGDIHVGTWQGGEGWTFKRNINQGRTA
jgi:hypothetical protein